MPTVVFVHPDGRREAHPAAVGDSVMDCAVDHGVEGIRAQCGGGCTCSTCHAVLDAHWFAIAGKPVGDERDILEFVPNRQPHSRLTCQIRMDERLDGLVVMVLADPAEST